MGYVARMGRYNRYANEKDYFEARDIPKTLYSSNGMFLRNISSPFLSYRNHQEECSRGYVPPKKDMKLPIINPFK